MTMGLEQQLRETIAAVNPADLTAEDRIALVELVGRCLDTPLATASVA